jgi:hypothetical protein
MALIERANEYALLWELVLPEVKAPPSKQFLMWAGNFDKQVVERGITRTAEKFRITKGQMSVEGAHRYCSSVMRHLTEDWHKLKQTRQQRHVAQRE